MKIIALVLLVVCVALCPCMAASRDFTPVQIALWEPAQIFPEEYEIYGLSLNLISGKNTYLYGVEVGLVNRITIDTRGIQVGLVNNGFLGGERPRGPTFFDFQNSVYGIQVGLMNNASGFRGIQAGVLNWHNKFFRDVNRTAMDNWSGVAVGLANISKGGSVRGIQCGALGNIADGEMSGIQIQPGAILGGNIAGSLYGLQVSTGILPGPSGNIADTVRGVQLAVCFNKASEMRGVQIGLVNVAQRLRGVQIGLFNIIREGFLPFCPILNVNF